MAKYIYVGTTRDSKGNVKVRFTNTLKYRSDRLRRAGHRDINFVSYTTKMPKLELLKNLINEPGFQSDETQDAIFNYVVRNCESTQELPLTLQQQQVLVTG